MLKIGDIKFPELWEIRANCHDLGGSTIPPGEQRDPMTVPGYYSANDPSPECDYGYKAYDYTDIEYNQSIRSSQKPGRTEV